MNIQLAPDPGAGGGGATASLDADSSLEGLLVDLLGLFDASVEDNLLNGIIPVDGLAGFFLGGRAMSADFGAPPTGRVVANEIFDPEGGPAQEAVLSIVSVLTEMAGMGCFFVGDGIRLALFLRGVRSMVPSASAISVKLFVVHILHLQNLRPVDKANDKKSCNFSSMRGLVYELKTDRCDTIDSWIVDDLKAVHVYSPVILSDIFLSALSVFGRFD